MCNRVLSSSVINTRICASKLEQLLAPNSLNSPEAGEHLERVLAFARQALGEHRKVEISYCGSSAEPVRRVVHLRQRGSRGRRWYAGGVVREGAGFRHFRADRIIDARLLAQDFRPSCCSTRSTLRRSSCEPTIRSSPRLRSARELRAGSKSGTPTAGRRETGGMS